MIDKECLESLRKVLSLNGLGSIADRSNQELRARLESYGYRVLVSLMDMKPSGIERKRILEKALSNNEPLMGYGVDR